VLNLPTPTSILKVVTGSAVTNISVHASFIDLFPATNQVTPGWQNVLIAAAITTTVVASPPAGADRNVKFVAVNNASGAPCAVSVDQFDGTLTSRVFGPVTLLPSWSLHYTTDGVGWVVYDAAGKIQEG
jgi:hypothetical protein